MVDVVGLQPLPDVVLHLAHGHAYQLGGPEHRGRVLQGLQLPGVRIEQALGQDAQGRLGDGEVSRSGDGQGALAGRLIDAQLAIGRDVVEPGVGAGVGEHHQAFFDQDSGAVGHVLVSQTSGRESWRHAYA